MLTATGRWRAWGMPGLTGASVSAGTGGMRAALVEDLRVRKRGRNLLSRAATRPRRPHDRRGYGEVAPKSCGSADPATVRGGGAAASMATDPDALLRGADATADLVLDLGDARHAAAIVEYDGELPRADAYRRSVRWRTCIDNRPGWPDDD